MIIRLPIMIKVKQMPEYREVPKSLSRVSSELNNDNRLFDYGDFDLTPPELLFKDLEPVKEKKIELVHPDKLFARYQKENKNDPKKEGKNKNK